jgi:hypothetical protein
MRGASRRSSRVSVGMARSTRLDHPSGGRRPITVPTGMRSSGLGDTSTLPSGSAARTVWGGAANSARRSCRPAQHEMPATTTRAKSTTEAMRRFIGTSFAEGEARAGRGASADRWRRSHNPSIARQLLPCSGNVTRQGGNRSGCSAVAGAGRGIFARSGVGWGHSFSPFRRDCRRHAGACQLAGILTIAGRRRSEPFLPALEGCRGGRRGLGILFGLGSLGY